MNNQKIISNRRHTKDLFNSFYKWSNEAIDKEFRTALWEHINISEMGAIQERLDRLDDRDAIVLEAGCGNGRILFDLKKRYRDAVGLDFSAGLLKKAMEIHNNDLNLVQSELQSLPFRDESFDIVVCIRVIQHMLPSEQQLAINEMSRILKKNGHLILMTYNALTPLAVYKQINMSGLNKIWPWWPLRDWKWMVDDYSFPWELEGMFRKASMEVKALQGAVCGEPEILKFLKLSKFLEKEFKFTLRRYLKLCRKIGLYLNKKAPFKFFLGRVLIEGRKNG
ncbi:MAG: class I SAM-dependent methyltransferase [Candidatus Omnitrophica bacterium]|nr:class I SAM-dependent methyltransferase [Candidatus Omnitrophota bacterium]